MARRPRRSTSEVRHLILTAARDRFAAEGFAGATTIAISADADVSETVLFRHFPTKELLFEAAVLEPFEEFLARYTAGWQDLPLEHGDPEAVLRVYAAELYDIVDAERELFAALMARGFRSAELTRALRKLDAMGDAVAKAHGLQYDTPVSVRAAFAMVVSTVVFGDALFTGVRRVSRDRIVTELGDMLVGAALHRRSRSEPATS